MDFSGWEKLSLVDFDHHISTTLFMAGCPFRCPFCHNADLVLNPGEAPKIPFEEILSYLKKRVGILDAVCITGGEPTLMPDLKEKIKAIKDLGYLVKLDTNGWNPDLLEELLKEHLVDCVAMDIKNAPMRYSKTAGVKVDLEKIDRSVRLLEDSNVEHEFRTTIMKEFHDEESMEEIGHWIAGCKHYFLQRYIDNEHCIEHGFHPISKEKAEVLQRIVARYVPSVALRDYDANDSK